jgi:hypothetical protein
MFDDANPLECYRRAESILPQQALTLQNSRQALHAAERIAARLDAANPSDAAFLRAAFETVLACVPTPLELAECERALEELQDLGQKAKRPDARQRARATVLHALLNHNDFVTIR